MLALPAFRINLQGFLSTWKVFFSNDETNKLISPRITRMLALPAFRNNLPGFLSTWKVFFSNDETNKLI
jgi:hypothetical protein